MIGEQCLAYLNKLLANFVYLQYKLHSIHTDMTGPSFMPIHWLFNDVYQFFGDDHIDWIKERVRVLGGFTPASILELSKLTDIKELKVVPPMIQLMQMAIQDLRYMEWFLQEGIDHFWEVNDLVTQDTLINFADAVWVFRRKIESSLPSINQK